MPAVTPPSVVVARDAVGNPTGLTDPLTGRTPGASVAVLTDPSTLGNLTFWLDASEALYTAGYAAVCTTLGDAIGVFPDASGAGNPATIVAGAPTYDPTGINGHPAIQLSGSSYLKVAGLMTASYANALSVYVVAKTNTGAMAAEQLLVATATPNFWIGPNTAGVDVTAGTVSPTLGTTAYDSPDGVFAVVVGAVTGRSRLNRNTHGAGSSANSLNASASVDGLAITGSIAFTGQDLFIGASATSTSKYDGKIGEILVFNAAHTAEQSRQVVDYLSGKWGFSAKPLVLCVGDSLTSGQNSTGGATQTLSASGNNYPSVLLATAAGAYDVRTDAYPGRTLAQIIAESPTYGMTFNYPSTGKRQIAVLWAGSNSLAAMRSRRGIKAQHTQAAKMLRTAGFKVIAVDMLNRNDSVYSGFHADQLAFNAWLHAGGNPYVDAVAKIADDARLQTVSNLTYFGSDQVHLTDAGYAIIPTYVDPLIRSLF